MILIHASVNLSASVQYQIIVVGCKYNGAITCLNKEVFVKHEKAPTAPKLEGVWVFVDLKYISYENRYFWPI